MEPPPRYTVELRVSTNEKDAQRLVKSLSLQGIDSFYTPLNNRGRVEYRVRSGVYDDPSLARKQVQFLESEFQIDGSVRRL